MKSWSIGVDVSKKGLDVCAMTLEFERWEKRFPNTAKGISQLLAWADKLESVLVIGMESTGGYEMDLAMASAQKGYPTSVENPRKIKNFAGAKNAVNKTDKADARLIAEFFVRMGGSKWHLADPILREISLLTRHRGSLMAEVNRMKNRLEHKSHMPELVVKQLERAIQRVQADLEEVERARIALVKRSETISSELKALTQIKGISTVTALLILSEAGDVDQFEQASSYAAFAGLSPCRRESGEWKGRTSISKRGSARLRGGLMMPTLVGAQHNPVLKAFRDRLIANGKTKMQATVACMRKLLMLCYGVLKAIKQGKTPFYGFREKQLLNP